MVDLATVAATGLPLSVEEFAVEQEIASDPASFISGQGCEQVLVFIREFAGPFKAWFYLVLADSLTGNKPARQKCYQSLVSAIVFPEKQRYTISNIIYRNRSDV